MKSFAAAAAALICAKSTDASHHQGSTRLRALKPKDVSASKSRKASKSAQREDSDSRDRRLLPSLTGTYAGIDTEDGTTQSLTFMCQDDLCNITLEDAQFSTCAQMVGGYFDGVGIATNVKRGNLDNFSIDLYCIKDGEDKIDFNQEPTTTLVGDMELLPQGGIHRHGPGFTYFKKTNSEVEDASDGSIFDVGINDKSRNVNGRYKGTDLEDGSGQLLEIACTRDMCDMALTDIAFSACNETGRNFFRGFAVAHDVPRDSLDSFDFSLFCLPENQTEIDIDDPDTPSTPFAGVFDLVGEGIISRSGTGINYLKVSDDGTKQSIYEDFTKFFYGSDLEDGSSQSLEVTCENGLCDIILGDASFSTCINNIPGDMYLGGLATAKGGSQDSLHNFDLDLYCVKYWTEIIAGAGINFTSPVAQLAGDLVFLQDGIVRRTAKDFFYYNEFKGGANTKIGNGLYAGVDGHVGGYNVWTIWCNEQDNCEVTYLTEIFTLCLLSRPVFNGVAVNTSVPRESLQNFDLPIYCVPSTVGAEINYTSQEPVYTINANLVPGDFSGTIHVTDEGGILFTSSGSDLFKHTPE